MLQQIYITSAYIRCAHSGTSTRSLHARILGCFAPSSFVLCIRILVRFVPSGFVLRTRYKARALRSLALLRDVPPSSLKKKKKKKSACDGNRNSSDMQSNALTTRPPGSSESWCRLDFLFYLAEWICFALGTCVAVVLTTFTYGKSANLL